MLPSGLARPSLPGYLVAAAGVPRFALRQLEIEAEEERHRERLAAERERVAAEAGTDALAFARSWRALAGDWSFDHVNALIDQHNRWYPIERKIPLDPRTGAERPPLGASYRREPLDVRWILEQFPLALAA